MQCEGHQYACCLRGLCQASALRWLLRHPIPCRAHFNMAGSALHTMTSCADEHDLYHHPAAGLFDLYTFCSKMAPLPPPTPYNKLDISSSIQGFLTLVISFFVAIWTVTGQVRMSSLSDTLAPARPPAHRCRHHQMLTID